MQHKWTGLTACAVGLLICACDSSDKGGSASTEKGAAAAKVSAGDDNGDKTAGDSGQQRAAPRVAKSGDEQANAAKPANGDGNKAAKANGVQRKPAAAQTKADDDEPLPTNLGPNPAAAENKRQKRGVVSDAPLQGGLYLVEEPHHDFGEVWQGEKIEYAFTVKNTGDRDLKIMTGKADCHCTKVEWDKVIPPGSEGKVGFLLDTAGLGRELTKGANFTTNDPQRPMIRCVMTGFVKNVAKMSPNDGGSFTEIVNENAEMTRKFVVESLVEEPIKLRLMPGRNAPKFFDVKIKALEPGRRWEVTLKTVPPLPAGFQRYRYYFDTGFKGKRFWDFTASYFRPERIAAKPMNMRFPVEVFTEAQTTRGIDLINHGKNPIKITKVEVPDEPAMDAAFEETDPGHKFKVKVTAPVGYFLAKNQNLIIHTDDPEMPQITVPIFATPDERTAALIRRGEFNKDKPAAEDGAKDVAPKSGDGSSGDEEAEAAVGSDDAPENSAGR